MNRRTTFPPPDATQALTAALAGGRVWRAGLNMKIRQQRSPSAVQVGGPSVFSTRGDAPCNATIRWT